MAESNSVSGEAAPRSAQTGQNSLFWLNAVPQTSHARLLSVFTGWGAGLAPGILVDLVADGLHKMPGGRALCRSKPIGNFLPVDYPRTHYCIKGSGRCYNIESRKDAMIWGESFQWLWLDPSADGRQDWRATGSTLIVPYYLRLKA